MTAQPPSNRPGPPEPDPTLKPIRNNGRQPLRLLAAGIALTAGVLGVAGWHVSSTHRAIISRVTDDLRLQKLRGTILHFDEILTMSARMAAATGDSRWEERYRQFEPALDVAIKKAIRLAPEAHESESAAQTDAANLALVNMENEAFTLVRQGRREAAWQVLFSGEYEEQKQVYASGMEKLDRSLAQHIQQATTHYRQQMVWLGLLMFVAVAALVLGWITVFIVLRTHLKKRVLAEKALENTHRDLELRVEQRTNELAQTNRDLNTEIIERQRTVEELRTAKETAEAGRQEFRAINIELESAVTAAKRAQADIEQMNAVMMGREGRVLEMKQEVNDLLAQLGQERKYEHT